MPTPTEDQIALNAKETPKERMWLTKGGIAAALQVNRNTIGTYLGMPDAPRPRKKKYELNVVRDFIASKTTKDILNNERKEKTNDLRETLLSTRAEEAAFDLGVKRGKYVEREKVEPAIVAFNNQLTADLQALFEFELPSKYEGKTLIERQQLNAAAIDTVLKRLKAGQTGLLS